MVTRAFFVPEKGIFREQLLILRFINSIGWQIRICTTESKEVENNILQLYTHDSETLIILKFEFMNFSFLKLQRESHCPTMSEKNVMKPRSQFQGESEVMGNWKRVHACGEIAIVTSEAAENSFWDTATTLVIWGSLKMGVDVSLKLWAKSKLDFVTAGIYEVNMDCVSDENSWKGLSYCKGAKADEEFQVLG